ncbi:MAG: hypothetical protein WKF74_16845 [Pyrinomonadaceae bacterium]
MPKFYIEEASINFRAFFNRMLSSLPVPGTSAFATLCKRLHPYGMSPSGIELEAPTAKLSDVTMIISLLQERLMLRMTYGWFEVFVRDVGEDELSSILTVIQVSRDVSLEVDNEVTIEKCTVGVTSHLILPSYNSQDYINEYLHLNPDSQGLVPEAFSYNVSLKSSANIQDARVVVAKSAKYEGALFIDVTLEYKDLSNGIPTEHQAGEDYRSTLALLSLEPTDAPEGDFAQ